MRFPFLAVVIAAAVHLAAGSLPAGSPTDLRAPFLVTQVPAGADTGSPAAGPLRGHAGDGGRLLLVDPDGTTRVLTAEFHSAADPDVSFDGKRILFAGKRAASDPWNVFELDLDTSKARQITRDHGNCRQPIYQSTLYTIDSPEPWYQITFVSDADGERNPADGSAATSLYSCRLDGSEVRRITFRPWSSFDPFLMPDGRILFATWQGPSPERDQVGRVALLAINSDGTDVSLLSGDEGGRVKQMPTVTTDGLAVFVEPDPSAWDGAGQLAAVRLQRNLHSYRRLTDEPAHRFHSPSPLAGGGLLVSRRPADGSATAGVFRLDPGTGAVTPVFDDPERHDLQARAVRARPKPDGRSSVVNYKYPNGQLYCLNPYLTDLEDPEWMPAGTVRRVRVLEGIPSRGADGPPRLRKRFLGEIDVMSDGSFNVAVPANTPIQLQLLDDDGMALRSCDWIWARNREPRGCIGCHEDGELTPENRFVEAVSVPSVELTAPPGERRAVDFRRDVMPILEARCATSGCHGGGRREPDLSDARSAYDALLKGKPGPHGRYIDPGRARTSPLLWRLLGRNTSRPWDRTWDQTPETAEPHGGRDLLSAEERRTLVEWIDLGALWDGLEAKE
jgi:Tol biopolymer transport system component